MAILVVFFLHLLLLTSAVHYLPGDIAINCGSTGISTAFNGREWIGDIKPKSTPSLLIKGSSTSSSTVHNLVSADPCPLQDSSNISYTILLYISSQPRSETCPSPL
ncbi:putative receptor-like protein kinase [Forsythia ovata]|uniref:Receptor-like protein kinase n=1 Tax=Forsythia ovata TaxID=205694 RepID=A0ABD1UDA4_9LAMI